MYFLLLDQLLPDIFVLIYVSPSFICILAAIYLEFEFLNYVLKLVCKLHKRRVCVSFDHDFIFTTWNYIWYSIRYFIQTSEKIPHYQVSVLVINLLPLNSVLSFVFQESTRIAVWRTNWCRVKVFARVKYGICLNGPGKTSIMVL